MSYDGLSLKKIFYYSPVEDEYSQLKKIQTNDENSLTSKKYTERNINRPKQEQIERIVEYKKKFSNYSKRNTYLASSDVDEIKLFDR